MQHILGGGDWAGTLVAMTLILGDVGLHLTGHSAEVFDQAIPIIVALYLGGRTAITAKNGSSPAPPPTPPATSEHP